MRSVVGPCAIGLCAVLVAVVAEGFGRTAEEHHRRARTEVLETHTLHPPYIADFWSEGLGNYWSIYGSTVITDKFVRLTPDAPGRKGSVWNIEALPRGGYEFTLAFRVHSKSPIGADGLALWLVEEMPRTYGPLFGHPQEFYGIGIAFDSYDNDARRNNPAIHLLYKDPTSQTKFSVDTDFDRQSVASCEFDYRNSIKPDVILARLVYQDDTVQLFMSHSNSEGLETKCLTATGMVLPEHFFVGVTADTGGVTDHHDVYFLHTVPLRREDEGGDEGYRPFSHHDDKKLRHFWREKTPEEAAADLKELEQRNPPADANKAPAPAGDIEEEGENSNKQ